VLLLWRSLAWRNRRLDQGNTSGSTTD
jgi:hypothetical protein